MSVIIPVLRRYRLIETTRGPVYSYFELLASGLTEKSLIDDNKMFIRWNEVLTFESIKKASLMHIKNNPFEASALTTILVVSDMAKSKSFYVDVLGAKIFREYGGDSLVLEFLGNWILLVTPGGPSKDKPDTHFVAPADKNSVSHSFTIRVKNCAKSYEILKQNGADFITPPITRGAETRCFFHDPDGHLFEISEYKTSLQ